MYTAKQYVEIFHLLFIRHLETCLDKNLYALKGGCNLRFFFKSIRYSEDIDFDVQTIAKDTLQKKINKLLESLSFQKNLQAHGLEIESFSEPKQTETTQRWKIGLRTNELTLLLPTKIEFSRRGMHHDFKFESIDPQLIQNYHLYPILANHYTLNAALAQKIDALIYRTETQARDVFDIQLLLNFGSKIQPVKKEFQDNIEQAILNILSIDFPEFKAKVVAFLLNEYQAYYNDPNKWHEIQEMVISALEKYKYATP